MKFKNIKNELQGNYYQTPDEISLDAFETYLVSQIRSLSDKHSKLSIKKKKYLKTDLELVRRRNGKL